MYEIFGKEMAEYPHISPPSDHRYWTIIHAHPQG